MNTARMALLASALLGTLALAAAAFAAPSGDGAAESGGAQALPVVPSEGGGSEPLGDLLAPGLAVPPSVPMPPVQEVPETPQTTPGEVVVPLEVPGATTEGGPVTPPEEGASNGGGFSFLALTGSGLAAGIAKVAAALLRAAPG